MDSQRGETDSPKRKTDTADGIGLRTTRRGTLVLQTENARRMMRRLARRETDQGDDVAAAPARP